MSERSISFLRPFEAVWKMLTLILVVTGRVLGVLLALGLMIAGIALTVTIVGGVIGIPFAILGFLLMIRSIF